MTSHLSSTNTNNLTNQENATTRIMGKTTTTNKPLQPLRRAALDDLGNRIHNLQNANQTTKGTIMGPPVAMPRKKIDVVKKKTELSVMSKISDKDMSLLEERIKRSSRRSVIPKHALVKVTVAEVPPPSRNGMKVNETVVMNNDEGQDMDEEEESVPVPMIMPLSPPNPVIANKYSVYQGLTTADPEIIKGIKLIGTQNLAMGLQGLTQFLDLMNSPTTVQTFTDFEEDFVNAIVSLLRYLQTLDPVSDPTVARIYRYLFKSIDTFYQKPLLGKRIPVASLKQLINQLIILLVEKKLEKCGDVYVKAINVYCVQIIEQSDHTAILCALVKLMTECITNDNCPERQVDLVMKCLWKVMKLMPTWGENVDYESVLLEVHQFLVKFPSKWWTKRPVDTPLRTIMTILHSTVKIKGANSMQLLSKIPNPAESEMESYILRLLKQTTATGVKPKSKQAKSPIKSSLSSKTVSPTKKPQNKPIITLPTVRIESPMKYYSPPQNLQKPQIIQNVSTENNCFPKEKQSYKGTPNIYSNTTPRQRRQKEIHFKKWLNALLTPPTELNAKTEVDVALIWQECKKKEISDAPTKVAMSFNLHTRSKLDYLRKKAQNLFRSKETGDVLQKVCLVVETGKLSIREDKDLHLNLKLRSDIVSLIMSYNPLWLRVGLETIYNEIVPLQSNSDTQGLTRFILERLLKEPHLLKKHKTVYSAKYCSDLKKFMLKKVLILVYFLDKAKNAKLIQHDPCLFCKNAIEKESKLVLTHFARETLSAVDDITKYLKCLGYEVTHAQSYIHEFDYAVENLGTDLRDGVRLARIMEIIQIRNDLTSKLRVPAILRHRKIHNMQLVFKSLQESGYEIQYDICAKDIVDGHKEKTLSFLWQIIYKFKAPLMVKSATIIQTWFRSFPIMLKRCKLRKIYEERENAAKKIQRWYKRQKLSKYYFMLAGLFQNFMQERKQELITIKIQSFFKMVICRKKYLIQFSGIIKLQAYARGWLIRHNYRRRIVAAKIIQKWLRGYMYRRRFMQLKNVAIIIQRKFRAKQEMRKHKLAYEDLKLTTINIQRRYRATRAMVKQSLYYKTLKKSVILIQRKFRANKLTGIYRSRFLQLKNAATVIQNRYRAKMLMVSQVEKYSRIRGATLIIQRKLRATILCKTTRQRFLKLKHYVRIIQAHYRANQLMKKERGVFLVKYKAVVTIQRFSRGFLVRKKYSSLLTPEAIEARRLLQVQTTAAVKIQEETMTSHLSSTNTNNLTNQENATTRIMGKTTTTNKPLQPLRRAALDDLGNRIHNLQNANQTTKGTIMGPPVAMPRKKIDVVKKKTELSVMSKEETMTSHLSSTNTNNLTNQENATTRIMGKTTTTNKPLQPLRRAALDDLGNRIHNLQNANQTTKGTIMGPPVAMPRKKIDVVKKKTELSVMSKENILKKENNTNVTESKVNGKQPVRQGGILCQKKTSDALKNQITEQTKVLTIYDPDKNSRDDPQMVTEYVEDIMSYLRELENEFPIKEKFLENNKVTPKMRATLVNWLVEAHKNFHLDLETLFSSISITDRYLQANTTVDGSTFQLVGTAALLLAAKYEESCPPEISDFVYICDDAFTKKQFLQMEINICKTLDYRMGWPVSIHFLKRYSKVAQATFDQHTLAKYILELALLEYNLAHIKPSIQAAAACCLSIAVLKEVMDPARVWTPTLVHYSTYKYYDFKPVLYEFAHMIVKTSSSKLDSVREKYSSSKFGKISLNLKLQGPLVSKLTSQLLSRK